MLGFKAAPYLEFVGNSQMMDMGTLKSFSADDDGEHLNALLGKAGNKLLEVSNKTIEVGKAAAQKAVEGGKVLADRTQEKIEEMRSERQGKSAGIAGTPQSAKKVCTKCGFEALAEITFCSACGTNISST